MFNKEIFDFLKDNLNISLDIKTDYNDDKIIKIKLLLKNENGEEEEIASVYDYLT